ncbi:integrating conjugative element protein [Xenorhabdus griffiniae]|uniref:Integrating conjugative element protein n=1 Tax=Xenorhabdus griffiniae TaxID=351672 RepID=A0ABY9XF16_9GAMM|nr:integrating conjugative element protein [Xenorhabdus griffiniae]MBD1225986.1 integrating conjugative element protein [Xenorhabdus griffiniae]MBE8585896.1 integrating conjugative element protein [Xenorhabdus griffiniae]WMV71440.1 integrating conjugative element protein [Xenorhabdus griffiniae]WNH01117.1 integrating conjugative element protein [Xenorhabdus griffiniae]
MKLKLISALLLYAISFTALSELEVVADFGGDSTSYYFDAINNELNEWSESPLNKAVPELPSFEMVLPIKTPEMVPGIVQNRLLNLPGIGALFLVGDDELSLTWLSQNADKLQALNAVGMVVNVDNADSFYKLKHLYKEGVISPISGSDLAIRLQLTHYPVLITETGLTQQVP